MAELLLVAFATYLLHGTVLLGAAALVDAAKLVRAPEALETVWRVALFGAFATTLAALSPQVPWRLPGASPEQAPLDGVAQPALVRASGDVVATAAAATPAARAPERHVDAGRADAGSRDSGFERRTLSFAAPSSPWPARVVLALAVFAVLSLLRLAIGLLRERRAARRLARCADATLLDDAAALARRLEAPLPDLRIDARARSPYASGACRIAVPRWALALAPDERRGLLAHELAHLARRDPAWRALTAAAVALAAWHPLNRLAARRLDALAELACDARAARALGDGRPLARCLATCAEHVAAPVPRFAVAMARRRSALVERIQSLVEEPDMPHPYRTHAVRALAAALLVAGLGALPAIELEARAAARESVSILDINGRKSFEMDSSALSLEAEIDGEIRFNDAESDVVSLEDEAFIEQEIDGVERRIEFERDGDAVERRYFVDGDERPLDADGRAWLARVIPVLLRESGYDAEARVARLRARGGNGAVLAEIDAIRGDYARRAYLVALAESARLAPSELARAIEYAGRGSSDFERRSAYVALVATQALDADAQAEVLEGVAKLGSDFEQRTVLVALAPKLALVEPVIRAWSAAIDTIDSDFEKRTVLTEYADRDLPSAAARFALANADEIGSDFERRTVLAGMVRHVERDPSLARDYLAAAAGIGSDFERRTALIALLEDVELDAAGYAAVLDSVAAMGSDFEQRTVLVEVAAGMPADASLIRRYREIARGMGSFERGEAEQALDRFAML